MKSFLLSALGFLVLVPAFAGTHDGAPVQPNSACVDFVMQKEISLGVRDSGKALGDAVRACNTGMQKGCLEYVFTETQKSGRRQNDRQSWNQAILACKVLAWPDCIQYAHGFWQKKYREPRALEQAVLSCRNDVRLPCLEYAFAVEQKLRSADLRAFNGAVSICQKGVAADCLKKLYEDFIPRHLPNLNDEWGNAVRSCSRVN